MLFNSYVFLFIFLPITLAVFYLFGAFKRYKLGIAFLALASFAFYCWWNPVYGVLLLASALFNYLIGIAILKTASGAGTGAASKKAKAILIFGIACDLLLLGYFKYTNFFIDNINVFFHSSISVNQIILPLGISFFTFTQIAYLADAFKGKGKEYDLSYYLLFVSYFPHLIAGPILHHKEMIPQFLNKNIYRFHQQNLKMGVSLFLIGLSKKMLLADQLSELASPTFDMAAAGAHIGFFTAWTGAVAYTLQLYFDFSGYSDMAIGLGLMCNIRLPMNFMAPYKASNIMDFWRRWHITLSRFLRDYLYIPLGGNRKGKTRRYVNLFMTMLLGGLWHGANWTFVAWGVLHGCYLIVNNLWRELMVKLGREPDRHGFVGMAAGRALTFLAVVVAWVFFRSKDIHSALIILNGAFSTDFSIAGSLLASKTGMLQLGGVLFLLSVVLFAPSTMEMFHYNSEQDLSETSVPNDGKRKGLLSWRPSLSWAVLIGIFAALCIMRLSNASDFLYFQF